MLEKVLAIETQIHQDLTAKYIEFVRGQASENQLLMKEFDHFRELLTGVFKRDICMSNEVLQNRFSQGVNSIIGNRTQPSLLSTTPPPLSEPSESTSYT